MRDKSKSSDLVGAFRKARGQVQAKEKQQKTFSRGYSKRTPFDSYEEKLKSLSADTFKTFNAVDLAYYFRTVSENSDKRYVIANIKKDGAIFKRLMQSYTQLEIALMIEFLFSPEQGYIEVPTPNVLASGWCNTIFNDAKKWANNEPISSKKKSRTREWDEKEHDVKVGEW